jgi:hypothetical protein
MKHRLQIHTAVTHLLCDSLTTPVDAIVCRVIAVGLCDQDAELCTVSKWFGLHVLYDAEELGEVSGIAPHSVDENEEMNGGHGGGGKDAGRWQSSTVLFLPPQPRSAMSTTAFDSAEMTRVN